MRCLGRIVHGGRADDPRDHGRQSVKTSQTTSTAPRNTDSPYPTYGRSEGNLYRADSLGHLGGRSANILQQNATSPTNRTTNAQEQAMNWTNTGPRGLSVPTRWTVRQVRIEHLEPENEKSTPPIHPWISQTA
jgi:hypothetical protein